MSLVWIDGLFAKRQLALCTRTYDTRCQTAKKRSRQGLGVLNFILAKAAVGRFVGAETQRGAIHTT